MGQNFLRMLKKRDPPKVFCPSSVKKDAAEIFFASVEKARGAKLFLRQAADDAVNNLRYAQISRNIRASAVPHALFETRCPNVRM